MKLLNTCHISKLLFLVIYSSLFNFLTYLFTYALFIYIPQVYCCFMQTNMILIVLHTSISILLWSKLFISYFFFHYVPHLLCTLFRTSWFFQIVRALYIFSTYSIPFYIYVFLISIIFKVQFIRAFFLFVFNYLYNIKFFSLPFWCLNSRNCMHAL